MMDENSELSAYMDGELEDVERHRLEAALAASPELSAELEQLRKVRAMLHDTANKLSADELHKKAVAQARKDMSAKRLKAIALMAALAAACIVVAALVWFQNPEPPAGPGITKAPVVIVQPDEQAAVGAADSPEPAQGEMLAASADTPAQPMQAAKLNLTLKGTMMGSNPLAVIVTPDGREASYAEGAAIMDGVTLIEVQPRRVLVDNAGAVTAIDMAGGPGNAPDAGISGLWAMSVQENCEGESENMGTFQIVQTGATFTMDSQENGLDMPTLQGAVTGNHVEIVIPDGPMTVTKGEVNADRTQISLTAQDPQEGMSVCITLKKLPEEQAVEQMLLATITSQRREEMEAIGQALRKYSDKYGPFPSTLAALAPEFIDPAIVKNLQDRVLNYMRAAAPSELPRIDFASFQPNLPKPDRLLAYERALKAAYGNAQLPGPQTILKAQYTDPPMTYTITTDGSVHESKVENTDVSVPQAAAMRAMSQNYMKQLGLVIKMFENEWDGYVPGGWFTVYPEYLTDTNVLTSPVDEPGNLSYRLLFPAIHLEGYALELAQQRPELFPRIQEQISRMGGSVSDQAYSQIARGASQSDMPIVVETVQHPSDDGGMGRNVLFADGHVEFLMEPEYQGRIGPWLALAQ